MTNRRRGESGNVFFTLFGAIALVGVIGAATATLMRGPVGTMVTLNQRAKVDAQMQIAAKLAMLEAAQQANSGDCDSDGYVEPLPPLTAGCATHPTGGGCIPNEIGSAKQDAWGTSYGYCSWDHGASQCGTTGILQGKNAEDKTVIAVISAGPDRTFQTSCASDPTYVSKVANSDDIILEYTYAEAVDASGGLWKLKSGTPSTATIDKSIEVSGTAKFQSGITGDTSFSNGAFNFTGASGFFLPDQVSLPTCSASDVGSLRNDTTSGQLLQICDPAAPVGPHNHGGWVDVGGANAGTGVAGSNGQVQYNDSGIFGASAGFTWDKAASKLTVNKVDVTSDTSVGGALAVTGNTNIQGILYTSGAANVGGALNVTGKITGSNDLQINGNATINNNAEVSGNGIIDGTLNVTGLSTLTGGARVGQGSAGSPGISFVSASTTGLFYSSGGIGLSASGAEHAVVTSSGLDVTGNSTASGNIVATGNVAGTTVQVGSVGSGVGLYSDGAAGMELRTANTARMVMDAAGDIGIKLIGAPTADLDIGGVMRLRQMGATAGGSCGAIAGAITYASGDKLLVCSNVTGNWETIGTSGGGGGGAADFWTKLVDGRLYYTANNVGVGTNDPLAKLHVGGTFLASGTHNGTSAMPVSGAGTRLVFDPATGALRAGTVDSTQWDDSNVGDHSIAMGNNTIAGGAYSMAFGNQTTVSNSNSMALGLGTGVSTVSGQNALGIFMGNQSGVNLADSNTMGLFGGKLIIDPSSPSTHLSVNGTLTADIFGNLGAMQYCDEAGLYCFTAQDIAGGVTGAPGNNREILYNSGGVLGSSSTFVFTSAGWMGLGTNAPSASLEVAGTDSILFPRGTDAQRPASPVNGMMRYSSTGSNFEVYANNAWSKLVTVGAGGSNLGIDDLNDAIANYTKHSMALGNNSGIVMTSAATDNTFMGEDAGFSNTGGYTNTYLGRATGKFNVLGSENTYIGGAAGVLGSTGSQNVAIGAYAGFTNAGDYNVYVGKSAGQLATTGALNTVLGQNAAPNLTTGSSNVILGQNAAATLTTGGSNIVIGRNIDVPASGTNNYLSIGNTIYGNLATYRIGINAPAPVTALDVNGTLRMAYGGESCSASTLGAMYYSSASGNFYVCGTAGSWTQISTGASSVAAGSDTQVQYNSNGVLYASSGFTYSPSGVIVGNGTASTSLAINGTGSTLTLNNTGTSGTSWNIGSSNSSYGVGSNKLFFVRTSQGTSLSPLVIDSSGRVGISNITPAASLDVGGTDAILFPRGGTGNRPSSPVNGMMRYNSVNDRFEAYQAGTWQDILTNASLAAAPDRGIQFNSGNSLAAVSTFTYSSVGNVGIGIASPTAQLEVAGDAVISAASNGTFRKLTIKADNSSPNVDLAEIGFERGYYTPGQNAAAMVFSRNTTAMEGNLSFWTRNASSTYGERMRIRSDGKVGIGTTQPSVQFEVAATDAIYFPRGTDAQRPSTPYNGMMRYSSTGNDFEVYANNAWRKLVTSTGGLTAAAGSDTYIQYNSNGYLAGSSGLVYNSVGYVGIGTATPTQTLEVNGNIKLTGLNSTGYLTALSTNDLLVNNAHIVSGFGLCVRGTRSTCIDSTGPGSDMIFNVGAVEMMRIKNSTGNVGIGTATPRAKLEVAGTDAILFPIGQTSNRPSSPVNGMMRYNSVNDRFEAYQAGTWQDILTNASLAAAPDRGVQFNSGNSLAAVSTFTYSSLGLLGVGTATPTVKLDVQGPLLSGSTNFLYNMQSYDTGPAAQYVGGGIGFGGNADVTRVFAAIQGYHESATAGFYDGGMRFFTRTNGNAFLTERLRITSTGSIGIGTTGPLAALDMRASTDAILFPQGLDAMRPATPQNGMMRYSSTGNDFEVYANNAWQKLRMGASSAIALDDLSDAIADYTTGHNIAIGSNAGVSFLSTAQYNLLTGESAGAKITSGVENTVYGYIAFTSSTSGSYNTAIGSRTLPGSSGNYNTAVGYHSLFKNTSGTNNVGVGVNALNNITSSSNNTAIGTNALLNSTGASNIAIGYDAGDALTSGMGNLIIGYDVDAPSPTGNYQLNIGNLIFSQGVDGTGTTLSSGNIGIGTATPAARLEVAGTDAILFPRGGTGNRPSSPVNGMMRYNSTNDRFEAYQAGTWQDILTNASLAAAPDRGIQFNSGNSLAAVSTFTYNSAGYLGVGTASPSTRLEVAGATDLGDITSSVNGGAVLKVYTGNTASANSGIDVIRGTNVASTWTTPQSILSLRLRSDASGVYRGTIGFTATSTPAETITMLNNGNVGIYTSNPLSVLDLRSSNDAVTFPQGLDATRPSSPQNGMMRYSSTGNDFEVYANNAWRKLVTSTGGLTAAAGSDTQVQYNSNGYLAGASNLIYASNGYVGIGTSSPSVPLSMAAARTIGSWGAMSPLNAILNITENGTTTLSLDGNTVISNNDLFLGTTNTSYIRFGARNAETMTMDPYGKFGIGRTTPATHLDVNGTIRMAYGGESCSASTLGGMYYSSATGNFYVCGTAGSWTQVATGASSPAAGSTGYVQFNSGGNLGADSAFFWDNTNKYLGIGTTSPLTLLTVSGSSSGNIAISTNNTDTTGFSGLSTYENGVSTGMAQWRGSATGTLPSYFRVGSNIASGGTIVTYGNGSSGIVLTSTGRFGFGTATPNVPFEVQVGANQYANIYSTSASSNVRPLRIGTTGSAGSIAFARYSDGSPQGMIGYVSSTDSSQIDISANGGGGFMTLTTVTAERMRITAAGKVGIGTTSPATLLDAQGTIRMAYGGETCSASTLGAMYYSSATGLFYACGTAGSWTQIATGASSPAAGSTGYVQFNSGGNMGADSNYVWDNTNKYLGIGTASPTARLHVASTISYASGTSYPGLYLVTSGTGDAGTTSDARASGSLASATGSTNMSALTSSYNQATNNMTAGTISTLNGVYGYIYNQNAAATSVARAFVGGASIGGAGSITSYSTFLATSPQITGAGGITTAYGIYLNAMKTNGVTNGYGVFQLGASDKNYFAGPTGHGTTTPATLLDVQGTIRMAYGGESCSTSTLGAMYYSSATGLFYACGTAGSWTQIATGASSPAAGSTGYVQFNSGGTLGANGNFYWDNTNERLLIGSSTVLTEDGTSQKFAISDTSSAASMAFNRYNTTTASQPARMILGRSRGTTPGDFTIVQNGDLLGRIAFVGADGTDLNTPAAAIVAQVDGVPGADNLPGALTFNTTAAGANTVTERMRIDSSGRVGIGISNPVSALSVTTPITAASGTAYGVNFSQTLNAAVNSDALTALRINPTFTNGAFTGVKNYGLIVTSGSVGFGTSSPATALDVNGTIRMAYGGESCSASTLGAMYYSSATGLFYACGTAGTWSQIATGTNATAAGSDRQIQFNSGNSMAADSLLVYTSTGNLGIGTNTPVASTATRRALVIRDTTNDATLRLLGSGSKDMELFTNSTVGALFVRSNHPLIFGTNNLEKLRIDINGNVGIGTTSPVSILDLRGSTDAVTFPQGLDATRPSSPVNGMMRYSSTGNDFEVYANDAWRKLVTSTGGLTAAAGSDTQIQYNSNGYLTGASGLTYNSAGTVGVATGINFASTSTNGLQMFNTADQVTNFEKFQGAWGSNYYNMVLYAGGTGTFTRKMLIGLASYSANPTQITSSLVFDNYNAPGSVFKFSGATSTSAGSTFLDVGGTGSIISASSGTQTLLKIGQQVSQTGTAGYNALLINPTENTVGSGSKYLINAQVGGVGKFTVDNNGKTAIGMATAPATMLDVNGTIRMAYGGEACDASRLGAMYYSSATGNFYACGTAGSWTQISTGSSSVAAGSDRQIQFNSGSSMSAASTFVYTSAGNLGIGTANPSSQLYINSSAVAFASGAVVPGQTIATTGAGDPGGATDVRTLQVSGTVTGTSNVPSAIGTRSIVSSALSSGTISALTGVSTTPYQSGAGTVTNARGFYAFPVLQSTGGMTNYYAFQSDPPTITGAGTIGNIYGLYLSAMKITGVGTAWGVYQNGASDKNYFAGPTGHGTSSPATLLDVQGTIRMAYGGESCSASTLGAMYYSSATGNFYACGTAGSWTQISTGASSPAAGSTGYVQFNSGGNLGADSNYVWDNTNKYLGIGTASPTSRLHVYATGITYASGSSIPGETISISGAGDAGGTSDPRALTITADLSGSASAANITGLRSYAIASTSAGTTSLTGSKSSVTVNGAGSVSNGYGTASAVFLNGSGNLTNYRAFWSDAPVFTGSGTINAAFGLYLNPLKITGVTSAYGIYQLGASDKNYFAGPTGYGTTTPATLLDVQGTIRMAYGGESCSASTLGAMYYSSATGLFYACGTAGSWSQVATGANATAAGSNTYVQYNSGGSLGASANMTYSGGQLTVSNAASAGTGIFGSVTTGNATGVQGTTSSTTTGTAGIVGTATAVSGTTFGGYFSNASPNGYGLQATTTTGASVAIEGINSSTTSNAIGIWGFASGTSGATYGGYFQNSSTTAAAAAMAAYANGASGATYAGYFSNASATGFGVYSNSGLNYFSGNTGIGAASPATKLDVNGTIRMAYGGEACSASTLGAMYYSSATGLFYACGTAGSWSQIATGTSATAAGSDRQIQFNSGNSMSAASTFVYTASGSLGIGTSSPNVAGATRGLTLSTGATSGDANLEMQGNRTVDGSVGALSWYNTSNVLGFIQTERYGADNTGRMIFATVNAGSIGTAMTILPTGNIGVGTTGPAAKLDIAGEIRIGSANTLLCSGSTKGSIRYNSSTNALDYCGGSGPTWTAIATPSAETISIDNLSDAATNYTSHNMALGSGAGVLFSSGQYNVVLGENAGAAITTGSNNTGFGYQALKLVAGGDHNVGIGREALAKVVSGANNTGIGGYALYQNTGNDNTAIGYSAAQNTTGNSNVAIGRNTLYTNTTGTKNTAIGAYALNAVSASNSTAMGYQALTLATGANNIAIGYQAGDAVTSGANNIIIGYDVDAPSATASNQLNIGNLIFSQGIDGTGTSLSSGKLGIGTTTPAAKLDVADAVRIGSSQLGCAAGTVGAIRYNSSTTAFDYCGGSTPAWTSFASGITPAGSDQQVQLNNNGVLYASTGLTFSSSAGNLTVTNGAVRAGAGSISAPSLSFAGDTDTGIVNTAANALSLVTGSSQRMYIDTTSVSSYQPFQMYTGSTVATISAQGLGDTNNYAQFRLQRTADAKSWVMNFNKSTLDGSFLLQYFDGASTFTPIILANPSTFNVGIGSTGPVTRLDVNGTIRMAYGGESCSASTLGAMYYSSATGLFYVCGTAGSWTQVSTGSSSVAAGSDRQIQFNSGNTLGAASTFVYSSVGYLGIGTSSPATALDVSSGTYANNQIIVGSVGQGGKIGLRRGSDGTVTATIGYDTITGGNLVIANSGGGGEIRLDPGTGFTTLYANGVERLRAAVSGNIGIGTTTPVAKLDVNGDVRFSSANTLTCNSLAKGGLRYNSSTNVFDFCNGTSWTAIATPTAETVSIDNLSDAAANYTSHNLFLGQNAGAVISSGTKNILIGEQAGTNLTTGGQNTFIGWQTGLFMVSGNENTFIGNSAGVNSTGTANVMIGKQAGYTTTSGDQNIYIGRNAALYANGGANNVLIGDQVGGTLVTGSNNILLGFNIDVPASSTSNYLSIGNLIFSTAINGTGTTVSTGNIGIGTKTPATKLDVNGTIRMAYGGESCSASTLGAMYYSSATGMFYACGTAGSWTQISTGSSSVAAGSDQQVQINSQGVLYASTGLTFSSSTGLLNVTGKVGISDRVSFGAQTGLGAPSYPATALSSIGAATATNVIANTNYSQNWNWDTLTSGTAMSMASGSLTTGTILSVTGSYNNASSTGYILKSTVTGTSSNAVPLGIVNAGVGLSFRVNDDGTNTDPTPFVIDAAGNVGIGTATPATNLDVVGNIQYTGTITDVSDRRLKTDIHPLGERGSMLQKLGQVQTYSFVMKDDAKKQVEFGVMAQELEKTFPELVHTASDARGTKSVNYVGLIAPMIKAGQELEAQNKQMKTELATLKAQQDEIKTAMNGMQKDMKGMKAYTGYGIGKAGMDGWAMLLIGFVLGGNVIFFGLNVINRRKQKPKA